MFKYKVVAFVLLAVVFMSPKAYCQQAMDAGQVKIVSGNVIKVDVEGGVINVKTDQGNMALYVLTESGLFESTHHMSLIEIEQGDAVIIQYNDSSGRNQVISLEDHKVESK